MILSAVHCLTHGADNVAYGFSPSLVTNAPEVYTALVDYQAQDAIGAIIRERAPCTFNSLDGTDVPTRRYQAMVDGEHNSDWAARLPRSDTRLRHLLEN